MVGPSCRPRFSVALWRRPAPTRCQLARARIGSARAAARQRQRRQAPARQVLSAAEPTKANAALRIRPEDDPADAARLYAYNERDITAEAEASARIPDLPPFELRFWQADKRLTGAAWQSDAPSVEACAATVEAVLAKYNAELAALTGGEVSAASEVQRLSGWLAANGVPVSSLDEEHVEEALARPGLPPQCERALRIRRAAGSASVKKVFAIRNQLTRNNRLHDLLTTTTPRAPARYWRRPAAYEPAESRP